MQADKELEFHGNGRRLCFTLHYVRVSLFAATNAAAETVRLGPAAQI